MKKLFYIAALILPSFVVEGQIITTHAGAGGTNAYLDGTASQARFSAPASIAVHSNGDVYVADSLHHKIRKISGGNVTTFSGTGTSGNTDGNSSTATWQKPTYLTMDASGNMYVSAHDRIRKIDPSGNVTTFVSPTAIAAVIYQYGRLGEIEYDRVNNFLYAADSSGVFLKISSAGAVSNFSYMLGIAKSMAATGTAGGFYYISSDNNVYRVPASGPHYTFLSGHGGQAIEVNGSTVYIAGNNSNNQIIEVYGSGPQQNMFLPNPGDVNGAASGAACNYLSDIRISDASAGSLMIADHHNNKIKLASYTTTPISLNNLSPQAYTLCTGDTFHCSPGNGNATHYNWSRNGSAISSGANISGALTNTLSFNPLLATHSGTYTLHYGNISQNKQVNIVIDNYPQEFTSATASSATICAGLSTSLIANSTIFPNGSYQWLNSQGVFDNNVVATVSPTSTTSYSLTGMDDNGCPFSNTTVVTVVVNNCTGIYEYDPSSQWLDAFPNPVSDILYLSTNCTYTITDLLGKVHQTGKGDRVTLSELDKGIYFILMETDDKTALKRFMKL